MCYNIEFIMFDIARVTDTKQEVQTQNSEVESKGRRRGTAAARADRVHAPSTCNMLCDFTFVIKFQMKMILLCYVFVARRGKAKVAKVAESVDAKVAPVETPFETFSEFSPTMVCVTCITCRKRYIH